MLLGNVCLDGGLEMTLTGRTSLRWKRDKSEAEREELKVELEDEKRRSNALQERVGRGGGGLKFGCR